MPEAAVAGLAAGFAIAIPFGALSAYLVALSARSPLTVGVAAAIGVASADGAFACIAVFGESALAAPITAVREQLRWAAIVVLTIMAARGAHGALNRYGRRHEAGSSPALLSDAESPRPIVAFGMLFGATLINPATLLYFVALVAGLQAAGSGGAGLVFVVAALSASMTWQLGLVSVSRGLGQLLAGPRAELCRDLGASGLIGALAVAAAMS